MTWTASFNGISIQQKPWIDSLTVVWKQMFPDSPPPLKLWSDSGYVITSTSPKTDFLTLTKFKGNPKIGDICFYDATIRYTFLLEEYTLGEPEKIKLRKIYKFNFTGGNKYVAIITEIHDKKPTPIAIVYFQ